jgi:4-amino-4-deoxy-L-arabinose transferase-like glycosyltransferase
LTSEQDRYARASAAPTTKSPVGPSSAGFHLAFGGALRQAHAYLQRPGIVPALIILLWACAALPNLTVRSFIYEEGTNAEIARDVLAHGHFLQPIVYGVLWHDKPSLLSWLIAGVALVTGGINEWSARLPTMLSVLITALLVHRVTRHYASPAASLFAALSFLFCPLLLQKLTIAEPDTLITVLSFAALVVWWDGAALGKVTLWRWGSCGLLLAALALVKGPQPAAFFGLGTAAYLLIERRWRDVPGWVLCMIFPAAAFAAWVVAVYHPGYEDTWLGYGRFLYRPAFLDYLARNSHNIGSLFLELLPASILVPFIPWPWKRHADTRAVPAVVAPFVLYSGVCTAILVLWPGFTSRYAMPMAPSLAVLAGIAWDQLEKTRYAVMRRISATAMSLLAAYQIVLVVVVMPLFADRFGETRLAGEAIGRAIRAAPAPAYGLWLDTDVLFYSKIPLQRLEMNDAAAISPPAWLVIPAENIAEFSRLRPDLKFSVVVGPLTEKQLTATRLEQK